MRESTIVGAIRRLFGRYRPRLWFFKTHGSVFQQGGIPDLILCFRGRFVAFEVKTPKGEASKLQLITADEIRAAGGIVEFVTSATEVAAILDRLEASMADPGTELYALPELVDAAVTAVGETTAILSKDEVVDLLTELGLNMCLAYDEHEHLVFNCTDYQWISLSAALGAAVKTKLAGDQPVPTEEDEVYS